MVSASWLTAGVASFSSEIGIVQGRTAPDATQPRPVLHHTTTVGSGKSYAETCNIFYRRDLLRSVGGFEETLGSFLKGLVWGEDTDLAYRVRALGYRLAFCEEAMVVHHIVPHRMSSWLLEPLRAWHWANIVKRYPQIRKELLFWRYFFNRMTALFDLMLMSLLLALFVRWWFIFGVAPFLVQKYLEGGRHLSTHLRVVRLLAGSVRAFLLFCTLLYSSIRYRAFVL
jgi:GT2 family glycosyltransferase